MIIIKKYQYPFLMKTNIGERRIYLTKDGKLPSVTTILSETDNNENLKKWKQSVGEEKAKQIIKESLNLGSLIHEKIEKYIKKEDYKNDNKTNLIYKLSNDMANKILNEILEKNLEEVWGLEETIYFPKKYAGTIDCVGVYKGKETIIDFKSSKKIKSEDMIKNYFLQVCAYINAHNKLLNTNIKNGLIIMVSRDYDLKIFEINEENYYIYNEMWEKKLDEWISKNRKNNN
ncbi:MAG: PD-(D/E)XK nuclease-like domain-containing protein [Candidatus Dojkabacteria bacterium]|nr:PD-(D/E)XK nuclease-like domain-containing protein [Candidatus Dojkabacteria bacterium]